MGGCSVFLECYSAVSESFLTHGTTLFFNIAQVHMLGRERDGERERGRYGEGDRETERGRDGEGEKETERDEERDGERDGERETAHSKAQ
ncbi:hypothetical protein FHG87_021909 [Trinorchestia longiramus]|nr:hypothetical protein FHG87_021909 [Trinorchestia longiramus]